MSLLIRNRGILPTLANDLLDTGKFFGPGYFDFDLLNRGDNGFAAPGANIVESDKDFKIELAVPGLEKKDFKVEIENGTLTISSEKEEEKKEDKENYHRREFYYHQFRRAFV